MSEFRSLPEVLNEIDRWDGKIPAVVYGPDGLEKISSKIRRAVYAYGKTKSQEDENPEAKAERLKRMAEADVENTRRARARAEEQFWDAMPGALRAMGLAEQELHAIAALDLEWPAVKAVDAWMDGEKLFLTMGGPVGSGKTLAAASCLLRSWEHIECDSYSGKQWRPRWARFVKAGEIARLSYFDKNDKTYLERLTVVKWLVIDDLGTEAKYDTWRAVFTDLIDARARGLRRTIITTNLTSTALKEAYDTRVWRRLQDYGEFIAAKRPEYQ